MKLNQLYTIHNPQGQDITVMATRRFNGMVRITVVLPMRKYVVDYSLAMLLKHGILKYIRSRYALAKSRGWTYKNHEQVFKTLQVISTQ